MPYNKELGKVGEEEARKYLLQNDYTIIKNNYTCKCGEIDIIAQKEEYIIFIEVKTRTNSNYGFPIESISLKKRKSIIKSAKVFLLQKKITDSAVRFDVIEVLTGTGKDSSCNINHIENAFWEE
ncbi:MAG: YraN family protein [Deltaproteobacteria bacterium]